MKKAFVKSYGCQMNVYDASRMVDLLGREGFVETGAVEEADVVVLNTCHIREKAAEKVYSELGRLRVLKGERAEAGHDTKVVVAGCVAQAEGREILNRAPGVDVVVGPQSYHRLPQLLAASKSGRVVDTEFPVEDKFDHLPARRTPASPPSSPCRRAATSSAPSASCPIPAAPRSRARWKKSWPRPSGWRRPAPAS